LQPKGNELRLALSNRFGYNDGRKVVMSWDHLPFMQVFEADRAKVELTKSQTFANLLNNGVPLDEVNKYLDLEFSKGERYVKPTGSGQTTTGGQEGQSTQAD